MAKEKLESQSIEESEKILDKRLTELKNMMGSMEKKVSEENAAIKNSESHIEKMGLLVDEIKQRVEEEKSAIDPLLERSREQEKKVLELQSKIVKKIAQKRKNASSAKDITKKVENFFNKKLA